MNHLFLMTDDMKEKEFTYVDLGLPSGRLWASENAEGYYTFDDAREKFGELVPKPEAFVELWKECQWLWDVKGRRMVVVGPNNNTIFLPASGFRHCACSDLDYIGNEGRYWSCAPFTQGLARYLYFCSDGIFPSDVELPWFGFSVRLCRESH